MIARKIRIWPWLVWLVAFYAVWGTLILVNGWQPLVAEHWPIALAMALGSYVAGSTPMGGGTIGFPVLVLLFDEPAGVGRNFSFAVQAIGMTSAAIFIVCRRQPVAWRMLGWASVGALIGTPLGQLFVAPCAPDIAVKIVFAVTWASFGLMTLVKVREFAGYQGVTPATAAFDRNMGLFIGLFGGAFVASLTGVGIDMLIYTMLVLVCRADLKMAIPTSVILMSMTSLVGIASANLLRAWNPALYPLSPEVLGNWLAAAPVVILGAPLGAFIVTLISRTPTLYFVSVLCVLQFIWTCRETGLRGWGLAAAIGCVLLVNAVFDRLYRWGRSRAARAAAAAVDPGGAGAVSEPVPCTA